jgi:hypothetical protein
MSLTSFFYSQRISEVNNTEINGKDYNVTRQNKQNKNKLFNLCEDTKNTNDRQQIQIRLKQTLNNENTKKRISDNK